MNRLKQVLASLQPGFYAKRRLNEVVESPDTLILKKEKNIKINIEILAKNASRTWKDKYFFRVSWLIDSTERPIQVNKGSQCNLIRAIWSLQGRRSGVFTTALMHGDWVKFQAREQNFKNALTGSSLLVEQAGRVIHTLDIPNISWQTTMKLLVASLLWRDSIVTTSTLMICLVVMLLLGSQIGYTLMCQLCRAAWYDGVWALGIDR